MTRAKECRRRGGRERFPCAARERHHSVWQLQHAVGASNSTSRRALLHLQARSPSRSAAVAAVAAAAATAGSGARWRSSRHTPPQRAAAAATPTVATAAWAPGELAAIPCARRCNSVSSCDNPSRESAAGAGVAPAGREPPAAAALPAAPWGSSRLPAPAAAAAEAPLRPCQRIGRHGLPPGELAVCARVHAHGRPCFPSGAVL